MPRYFNAETGQQLFIDPASDEAEFVRIAAMTDEQLYAELRAEGVDPDELIAKTRETIRKAMEAHKQ